MKNNKKRKLVLCIIILSVLTFIFSIFLVKAYGATSTVTITFKVNGGSGTMSKQTVVKGEKTLLNANTFTSASTSKGFFGWNTSADGTGTYYAERDVINVSSNTTLYAQWQTINTTGITTSGGTISTGYYKLTKNITVSNYVGISAGNTVVLDLNGYVLKTSGENLVIRNRGTLTIIDSNPSKAHYGKVNSNNVWTWDSSKEGATGTQSGYVKITGGIITGGHPTTGTTGAGIYNYGNNTTKAIAKLVMNGGNVVGNYNELATGAGAGVRSHTSGLSETNGYSPCCTLVLNDTYIAYNYHGLNAGGVYASGDATITGCTITNNKAAKRGGAMRITSQYDTDITITDSSITKNIAGTDGGGINISIGTDNSESHATKAIKSTIKNTVISNNVSSGAGGGIAMYDDPNVDVILNIEEGTVVNGNTAENGGGVYMAYGNINMNAGEIYSNKATVVGGGVYLNNGTFTMNNGIIGKDSGANTAESGGGIYISDGNAVIKGGTIQKNEATTNGGGLYLAGGTLDMSAGTFKSNKAKNGAGAYVTTGTFNLTGGSFDSNTATTNGGGFYIVDCSAVKISNGSINNNTAKNGGGFYQTQDATTTTTILSGTCSINNNLATNGNGGGVYVAGKSTFRVIGGRIAYNKSTYTTAPASGTLAKSSSYGVGGGVYIKAGTFSMYDSNNIAGTAAIFGNTADYAADDLFASGTNTSFDAIPVTAMYKDDAYKTSDSWLEDYPAGEQHLSLVSGNQTTIVSNGRYKDIQDATKRQIATTVLERNCKDYICITMGKSIGNLLLKIDDTNLSSDQIYIYQIDYIKSGENDPASLSMQIAVGTGEGTEVTALPAGTYKIKLISGWSWRFSDKVKYSVKEIEQRATSEAVNESEFSIYSEKTTEVGTSYILNNNKWQTKTLSSSINVGGGN